MACLAKKSPLTRKGRTPWDTAKYFTDNQHGKGLSEYRKEDEASQGNKGNHHDLLRTEPLCRPTINHKTNDASCRRAVAQRRLPVSRNNIAVGTAGGGDTEAFEESRLAVERPNLREKVK